MKYGIILCSLSLVLLSCANDNGQSVRDMGRTVSSSQQLELAEEIDMVPPQTSEPVAPPFYLDKGSKIIRKGNIHYEVDNLTDSKNKVDNFVTQLRAYYEDEVYKQYEGYMNYNLRIRVQGDKFDSLLALLEEGVGELKVKNISAKDVTEEYVDLKIRLGNKLAVLAQYKVILQKAISIEEILEVNEKIRRLEEEIESKKGRIRFLDDRVSYSELNLRLSQKYEIVLASAPGFGSRVGEAFMSGFNGFLSFVVGLVYVWPFILLIFLSYCFSRFIKNNIRSILKSKKS